MTAEDNPLVHGPYHIEWNDEKQRFDIVLSTDEGMEVVDYGDTPEQAIERMAYQCELDPYVD